MDSPSFIGDTDLRYGLTQTGLDSKEVITDVPPTVHHDRTELDTGLFVRRWPRPFPSIFFSE